MNIKIMNMDINIILLILLVLFTLVVLVVSVILVVLFYNKEKVKNQAKKIAFDIVTKKGIEEFKKYHKENDINIIVDKYLQSILNKNTSNTNLKLNNNLNQDVKSILNQDDVKSILNSNLNQDVVKSILNSNLNQDVVKSILNQDDVKSILNSNLNQDNVKSIFNIDLNQDNVKSILNSNLNNNLNQDVKTLLNIDVKLILNNNLNVDVKTLLSYNKILEFFNNKINVFIDNLDIKLLIPNIDILMDTYIKSDSNYKNNFDKFTEEKLKPYINKELTNNIIILYNKKIEEIKTEIKEFIN